MSSSIQPGYFASPRKPSMLDYHKIKTMSFLNQYVDPHNHNGDVYIVAVDNEADELQSKQNKMYGPYKKIYLGNISNPRGILEELEVVINSGLYSLLILKTLRPEFPNEGRANKRTKVLQAESYYPTSHLQCIDFDYPKWAKILKVYKEYNEYNELRLSSDKYPKVKSLGALRTFIAKSLSWPKTDKAPIHLITKSFSTMKAIEAGKLESVSAHIYTVSKEATTHNEHVYKAMAKVQHEQTYIGLQTTKTVRGHPYLDSAKNSIKKWFEKPMSSWGIFGGELLSDQWGRRSIKPASTAKPIILFPEEKYKLIQKENKRFRGIGSRKASEARGVKHDDREYSDGDCLHPNHVLTVNDEAYCTVREHFHNFDKYPLTQLDSLRDPSSRGGLHYKPEAKVYIDYANGETTVHTMGVDFRADIPLVEDDTGELRAMIQDHVSPDSRLTCARADTNSGKSHNTISIPVGIGAPFTSGYFTVPTHSILNGLDPDKVVIVESGHGLDSDVNTKFDDIPEGCWSGMTQHKFAFMFGAGRGPSFVTPMKHGSIIVIDEVQNLFKSTNPSEVHSHLFDLITGKIDIGQRSLLLLSATFDFNILAPYEPAVVNFEHKIKKVFNYVRLIPFGKLVKARRAFLAVNDLREASVLYDFYVKLGRKVIVIHGKNEIDSDGVRFTHVPDDVEDLYDIIIVTSAMKEGYSLKKKYDIVFVDKAVSNHSGAEDDEQFASRVRVIGAEYFIRLNDKAFRFPDTKKIGLAPFREIAASILTHRQYELIKLFQLDPSLSAKYKLITDEAGIKVVKDELGALSLYVRITKQNEDRSFELTKRALERFGTEAVDGFTEEDKIIGTLWDDVDSSGMTPRQIKGMMETRRIIRRDRIRELENESLTGAVGPMEDVKAFRKAFETETKLVKTEAGYASWVGKYKDHPMMIARSKVNKIENVPWEYIYCYEHIDGEKIEDKLNEATRVKMKMNEGYRIKIRKDEKARILGIYDALAAKKTLAPNQGKQSIGMYVREFRYTIDSFGVEPPKERDEQEILALAQLYANVLYYAGDKIQKRYSKNITHVEVLELGVVRLEDILEERALRKEIAI